MNTEQNNNEPLMCMAIECKQLFLVRQSQVIQFKIMKRVQIVWQANQL